MLRPQTAGDPRFVDVPTNTLDGLLRSIVSELVSKAPSGLNSASSETIHHLKAVLDQLTDGIVIVDAGARITFANKALAALLGATPEELVGKLVVEAVAELGQPGGRSSSSDYDQFQQLFELGETFKGEFDLLAPQEKSIQVTALPLPSSANKPAGGVLVIRDNTETQRLRRKLSQTDVLFQLSKALNSAQDARQIAQLTLEAVVEPAITASIALLNNERTQIRVIDARGAHSERLNGFSLGVDQIREDIRKSVFEDRKPYYCPRLHSAATLGYLHQGVESFIAVPLVVEDRAIGVLGLESVVSMDLHPDEMQFLCSLANLAATAISKADLYEELKRTSEELREQKSKLEAFIEGIGDGMAIIGKDFRVTWQNRVTTESHGDIVGKLCYEAYKKRSEPCEDCPVVKVFDTGQAVNSSHLLYRKDGREYSSEDMSAPVYGKDGEIVGVVEVYRDVTYWKRIEREVMERTRELEGAKEEMRKKALQLHKLYARTIQIEEEGKRIAAETHDGVLQLVIGSLYEVQTLQVLFPDGDLLEKKLGIVQDLLSEAVREMRRMIQNLRPLLLDQVGLVESLKASAAKFEKVSGISCVVESEGIASRLSPEGELAVFRIVQEALQNVKKHAEASIVKVVLEFSGEVLKVGVVDNGKGFEEGVSWGRQSDHLGLVAMRERAEGIGATLVVESVVGGGTKVRLDVPIVEAVSGEEA